MYSKIAIGNVRKSFKDYSIYFLTITLAVCIFYSFNSIESQKALVEMQGSSADYIGTLVNLISALSVFVSVILGSLILYANNFLIKKRKKELGIYMTLGMSKNKISRILVIETLIVGICSLVSGLLLGLIASQGLSVLTSKLFEISMSDYSFIISFKAIGKTALYFGIMFLLVMIFNVIVISKYKIIDLLSAGKKTEDIKIKNPFLYIIAFIVCLVSIVTAYMLVTEVGLDIGNIKFQASILLGVVGTVLFFFSLSGFGLYIIKKNKKIYFKGLNIFVVKQINSKVNTNFISMSIICLMLFLTMGILSTGISFKNSLESGLEKSTPYDASARSYIYGEKGLKSIEEILKSSGVKFENGEKYAYYDEYYSENITLNDVLNKNISEESKKKLGKFGKWSVNFIKESEYNAVRELNAQEPIDIKDKEALVLCNTTDTLKVTNDFLKNNETITINNKDYTLKNKKAIEDNLSTDNFSSNLFTIVLNDEEISNFDIYTSNVNINYPKEDREISEEKFSKLFEDFIHGEIDEQFINGMTRDSIYSENKGMTTSILFVGIYLGIIFLIASMAVLALQQLSEASDSIDRYKSLKRLGANDKMIDKTIFTQTLIYFSLPLGLAFIHAVVGINVANDFIAMFNKPDIGTSSLFTALIFTIVYVGYFYATYTGYKNIIKNS
ncbi:FtsX-like permease family protein [Romboutsia sp.]|uniref:FtsX-like permease family protein n=1 Tax=Romboutsia sp. TaxID=1965302 RepID=UPI003F32F985